MPRTLSAARTPFAELASSGPVTARGSSATAPTASAVAPSSRRVWRRSPADATDGEVRADHRDEQRAPQASRDRRGEERRHEEGRLRPDDDDRELVCVGVDAPPNVALRPATKARLLRHRRDGDRGDPPGGVADAREHRHDRSVEEDGQHVVPRARSGGAALARCVTRPGDFGARGGGHRGRSLRNFRASRRGELRSRSRGTRWCPTRPGAGIGFATFAQPAPLVSRSLRRRSLARHRPDEPTRRGRGGEIAPQPRLALGVMSAGGTSRSAAGPAIRGSRTVNVVPRSALDSTPTDPPWAWTIRSTM